MPADPLSERASPLSAAVLMTLAAGVVVGASLAGRAVFSNLDRPKEDKKAVAAMPAPVPLPKEEPTKEPPATTTPTSVSTDAPAGAAPAADPVKSFVDASVKQAVTATKTEDAAALKAAAKDPAVQSAVGDALKASAEQGTPLLRRAWDAVWQMLTSFIKVKVTVKPETP